MKKAVVLLSGGLDSATALAIARDEGFDCHALSFYYGQKHASEIAAARRVAKTLGAIDHKIMGIDTSGMGGSALTDPDTPVPETQQDGIPATYVPARNTVFLALALGYAEVLESTDIFIGVNAVDYSGYPDCRPEYIAQFKKLADLATKAGVEGAEYSIHTPLIDLSKADIIQRGTALGVDYSVTVSCYQADENGMACGVCDSCRIRKDGFSAANITDPTRYVAA